MMIKLLIFDFDGTIARSKSLYLDTIYRTLKNNGYNASRKIIKSLLGFRLEFLLQRIGVNGNNKLNLLKKEVNKIVIKKSANLIACPYFKALYPILARNKCVLVTNSIVEYVMPFLRKHKLKFLEISGAEQFTSKQDAFKKLFKKFKIKGNEAIYIADRAQDADIAKEAGCKSIIISNRCSWSSYAEIKRKKPDYIIRDLGRIKRIISS